MPPFATFPPEVLPIAERDVKLQLPPGRPSDLPDLYLAREHPLHRGTGSAYYFLQNGSTDGMITTYTYEDNVKDFPQGDEASAVAAGYFKLQAGDSLYVRLLTASSSGLDDVAVTWVVGRGILDEQIYNEALEMQSMVLGPRNLRTRDAPDRDGPEPQGGTAFERSFPAKQNIKNGRCYGYGTSFEAPSRIFAPAAQGRIGVADEDTLLVRSKLLTVSTDIALRAVSLGPTEIEDMLRLNCELYNIPGVGSDNNFAFSSYQLNLAPPADQTLGDSMGDSGSAHIDDRDSPAHYTAVTAFSDLPARFDPGRLYIAYPGVFITLDFLTTVVFSGTRRHGSSPPLATADATIEESKWSARCIAVAYGATGPTQAFHKRPIGVAGVVGGSTDKKGKKKEGKAVLMNVTPEMLEIRTEDKEPPRANHSTFLSEGLTVMTPKKFMGFTARSFLQVIDTMMLQSSKSLGFAIDSDRFLSSFTYLDSDGLRRAVEPWIDGPGWRRRSSSLDQSGASSSANIEPVPAQPALSSDVLESFDLVSQKDHLAEKLAQWKVYFDKYAGHVPFAVAYLKSVYPLEGHYRGKPHKLLSIHVDPESSGRGKKGTSKDGGKKGKGKNRGLKNDTASSDYDSEAWPGIDQSLVRQVLGDARLGTADHPMEVADDSDDVDMDVDDEIQDVGRLPPFLKDITAEGVHRELVDLQNHIISEATTSDLDRKSAVQSIRGFQDAMCNQPLDSGSFGAIRSAWKGLAYLVREEYGNIFHSRKRRSLIMLTNYSAWNWLQISIPDALRDLRGESPTLSCTWLKQLGTILENALLQGTVTLKISTGDCGVLLEDTPPVSVDLSRYDTNSNDPEYITNTVVSLAQDVLAIWLRFPMTGDDRHKARYVGAIKDALGYEALLLDCVWTRYDNASKFYFRGDLRLPPLNASNAARFPIIDPNSTFRKDIKEIYALINDFFEGTLKSPSTPNVDLRTGRVKRTKEERAAMFKSFIHDSYRCVVGRDTIDNVQLQSDLRTLPDFYSPFRELAPSRVHLLSPGGPFAPENLRTLEGVFSALVGRAITFNSDFARTRSTRTLFTSPEDFDRATFHRPIPSFCNQSAYGRHANTKKVPGLVHEYWKELNDAPWPGLTAVEPISFNTCYRYFKPTRGTRFPELGELGAYLLTADYVYAGVVQYPTAEEIGSLVHHLNKGPVNALEMLGLIPRRKDGSNGNKLKGNESDTVEAFVKAHSMVMDAFTPHHLFHVDIDVFLTEHCLCKFSRAKAALGLEGWDD